MRWLPQAFIISAFCLLTYVTVQQNVRQSADDPQIQMAEDAAEQISNGASASMTISPFGDSQSDSPNTDIAQSLKPFLIVFDQSGKVISSSASLDGLVPTPPVGVFTYTDKNGEDRFTWQPVPQARIAAVLVKVPPPDAADAATTTIIKASDAANGFVLAGRSLREVEVRENSLFNEVALGWIIILMLSLGYNIFISGKNGQGNLPK